MGASPSIVRLATAEGKVTVRARKHRLLRAAG